MPPSSPDPLPEHLVATGPPRPAWRRAFVGTTSFNLVALAVLTAISAFVVLTPAAPTEVRTGDEQAADDAGDAGGTDLDLGDDEPVLVAGESEEGDAAGGDSGEVVAAPADVVGPVLRPSPGSPVGTSARPSEPAGPRDPDLDPGPDPAPPAPAPPPPELTTCDDFTTQPEAQAAFDADPVGLAGLDGDGDGLACEHLPGRVVEPPPPPPPPPPARIPTVDELVRPETKLHGVHTTNAPYRASELDAFTTAAGKAPNVILLFQNLTQAFPASAVEASWARGALPMVSLEPIVPGSTSGQPRLAELSSGAWDDWFRAWAVAARDLGLPVALRFAHEMNGSWYTWSDGAWGNARGDFVTAWRHVHGIFESVGATNVLWVWSVNRVDALGDRTLGRVYPGDAFVDWAGVSGYHRAGLGRAPTFDGTFGATLAELGRVAPTKPVVLTEVGVTGPEAERVAWIEDLFRGLLDNPQVIGFSWFNDFKSGGDYRIQFSAATAAAFAAGLADLRYGPLVG